MLSESELKNEVFNFAYFQNDKICRLCWNDKAEIDPRNENSLQPKSGLVGLKSRKNANLSELLGKILFALGLSISLKVNFPNKFCKECISKVNKICKFKTFCIEANSRLEEVLTRKVKPDDGTAVFATDVSLPVDSRNSPNHSHEPREDETKNVGPVEIDSSPPDADVSSHSSEYCNHLQEFDEHSPTPVDVKTNINLTEPKDNSTVKKNSFCKVCKLSVGENKSDHKCVVCTYKCFGCERDFATRRKRAIHESGCDGLKEGYKCATCDKLVPTRLLYDRHLRRHSEARPYACTVCGKEFKTRTCLKAHAVNHGVKTYICEVCGRGFTRRSYFTTHKAIHTGDKRYECRHCDYRTTQKGSLTIHERTHTGERPFSCDLCPRRCTTKSNLLAHRRRHDGVKKYQCQLCSKAYGYKVSLEEHLASCHERPSATACATCGVVYQRPRDLKKHVRERHGATASKVAKGRGEQTGVATEETTLPQESF